MISKLSDELRNLTQSMKPQTQNATHHPDPPRLPHAPTPQPAEQPALRSVIVKEVREMQERGKRKQSIIIKGLNASSAVEAIRLFRDLSSSKFSYEKIFAEVSPIKRPRWHFPSKNVSDEQRKHVLNSAKTLKRIQYGQACISRDLTSAQRTVLFEKRQAKRSQNPVTTNPACASPEAHDSYKSRPCTGSCSKF